MFRQENIIKPINVIPEIAKWLLPEVYIELGIGSCRNIIRVENLASPDILIGVDIKLRRSLNPSKFKLYEMTTDDFFYKLKTKEITLPNFDMVFIDACHKSEQVLNDFWNVSPFVTEQGVVILHDTYPPSPRFLKDRFCSDSWRAAVKLKEYMLENNNCGFEICTLPVPPGYTMIRKANKQICFDV